MRLKLHFLGLQFSLCTERLNTSVLKKPALQMVRLWTAGSAQRSEWWSVFMWIVSYDWKLVAWSRTFRWYNYCLRPVCWLSGNKAGNQAENCQCLDVKLLHLEVLYENFEKRLLPPGKKPFKNISVTWKSPDYDWVTKLYRISLKQEGFQDSNAMFSFIKIQ